MTTATLEQAPPARLDIEICRDLRQQVEIRADGGEMPTMAGHFSVFDTWYEIDSFFEGRFLERISPGAFRKTFRESGDRIRVLLEHGFDPTVGDKPLGVPRSLAEDSVGAAYEVPLFDTSYNRDLVPALEAGAYGASFRFRVVKDAWNKDPGKSSHNPDGIPERTIKEVRVMEFGPTVFPASPTATAGLRSSTDHYYEQLRHRAPDQYEDALRRATNLRTPDQVAPAAPDTPAAEGTGAEQRTEPQPAPEAATRKPDEPRKHSEAPKEPTTTPRSTQMDTMTVEERRDRQEEIRARWAEIDAEHDGAELSEEARAEFDQLTEEYDRHERAISDVETRRAEIAKRVANGQARTEQAQTDTAAFVSRKGADIYDLGEIRKQARSMDDMARLYRENAMRAVERARFGLVRGVSREGAQAQVERLLDTVDDQQGTLARRILVTGSPTYERAFGKAVIARSTSGLSGEEQRAMSLGTDSEGGFAVPFDLDPTVILTSDGSINPLRQVARVEQIVGKEWQGVTSTGITVTRSPEAQEATDNSPSLVQPTVRPTRVLGFVPFSMEVDQDWTRLRAEMTRLLNDAKEQEEADSFVNGDGTGANPSGIIATLAAGSRVGQTGAAGSLTVPDDLHAVEEDLGPRFRARASWLANKSIYNLIRSNALAAGLTAEDVWVRISSGQPPELIGYAARELSTMDGTIEASGAGNNLVLLFGDYMTGFLIVDRIGMSVELVPHLFGATNRFPTGQRGIVAVWRNSSVILADNALRVLNVVSPV